MVGFLWFILIFMLYFFYGPEKFRLKRKLDKVVRAYRTKHQSGLNLAFFNGEESNFDDFKTFIQTASLFNEKRLAVFRNVLTLEEKAASKLLEFLKSGHLKDSQSKFVVFSQEEEIKEKKLPKIKKNIFDFLVSPSVHSQKFDYLRPRDLKNWIVREVKQKGKTISSSAVEELIRRIGSDLFRLDNEIEKLVHYCPREMIDLKTVDQLVESPFKSTTFQLVDALAEKNSRKSLEILWEQIREKNEKPELVLGALIYQFRNLLEVKELIEQGENKYSLSKKISLHPFVFQKTLRQSYNFTLSQLKDVYSRLAQIDLLVKTGQVDLSTALELMIAQKLGVISKK